MSFGNLLKESFCLLHTCFTTAKLTYLSKLWNYQVVLMVKNPLANAGDIRDAGSIDP